MVVEHTRYKIYVSRSQLFQEAVRHAGSLLRFHCLRYELARCSEDRESYMLRIEWDSDGQMRRFGESPAGHAFNRMFQDYEADIQDHWRWELTDVVRMPTELLLGVSQGLGGLADRPPWSRLCPWILDHLHHKIRVEEMAENVHMSARNFARVFQRDFRMSPGQFLERVRVAAAKADLEQGALTAEQVAYARGFGSSSTMRRAFLRVLGETPSQYREGMRDSVAAKRAPAA